MTAPVATAIVPVYNGARFLERCLASLRAQDTPGVEIIVVDDGSTDGSPDLVAPPVRLLRTGGRRGAGCARNLGARAAAGATLFFTDADVEVPPDWVRKGLAALAEHDAPFGGGGYAGPVVPSFIQRFAHEELAWRRRRHHGFVRTLVSNNLYGRREAFLAAGGFPEHYQAASSEDMEFSWKAARRHRLWWARDNGVFHNYTPTLRAYLRQQFRFARDAVPMLLGHPGLLRGRTHHGKQLYFEVAATGLLWAGLAVAPWFPAGPLPGAAALFPLNLPFLVHLARRQGLRFAGRGFGAVFLRNSIILAGIARGLAAALFRPGRTARGV